MKKKILLIGLILSVLVLGGCTQYKAGCRDEVYKNLCEERDMVFDHSFTDFLDYNVEIVCFDMVERDFKRLKTIDADIEKCIVKC